MHTLIFRALWVAIFVLAFVPKGHADTINFFCKSEEMTNQIADALTKGGQESADIVAEPYLALGECQYVSEPIFVYIVHKGATFGDKFKVTVVGVARKLGDFPEFWGMMPTAELTSQAGSI